MENSDKNGYVYIFSNPELKGKIKIGKTTKNPEIRAEQLSKQTSSIGQFNVEWFQKVDNIDFSEDYLHYVFREFHYKKEYFLINIDLALKIAIAAFNAVKALHSKVGKVIKNEISIKFEKIDILKTEKENSNKEQSEISMEILNLTDKLSVYLKKAKNLS